MQWVARLASRYNAKRNVTGRALQFQTDTALLYSVCKKHIKGITDHYSGNDDLDEAVKVEKQAKKVSAHITANAFTLIRRAHARNGNGNIEEERQTCKSLDSNCGATSAFSIRKGSRKAHAKRSTCFSTRVMPSSIPGAGLGLFVDGRAEAGDLLTLYPGIAYRPSDAKYMSGFPEISKDNEYLMWRYDGVIIDGSSDAINRVMKNGRCGSSDPALLSSYAAGQYVNHPPPGLKPNALQYGFNFSSFALSPELQYLVPNMSFCSAGHSSNAEGADTFLDRLLHKVLRKDGPTNRMLDSVVDHTFRHRAPATGAYRMSAWTADESVTSIAIIATQTIVDEEIFINYRFNPYLPDLPNWYCDCDPVASKRRWSRDGFWDAQ